MQPYHAASVLKNGLLTRDLLKMHRYSSRLVFAVFSFPLLSIKHTVAKGSFQSSCMVLSWGPVAMPPVQGVIAIEGLDLRDVDPGWYQMICLPAKLGGGDGAPVRCVLHSKEDGGKENPGAADAGEAEGQVAASSSSGEQWTKVEPPAVVQPPAAQ